MRDTSDWPARVYKYRLLAEAGHAERLHRAIVKGEFWANTPATFNDPFDCCPSISMDATEGELVANFHRVNQRTFPDQFRRIAEGVEWARAFRAGNPEVMEHFKKAAEGFQYALMNKWGAFSLAERWDCELMWGHYAASHTGVCLEFDTSFINEDFSFGRINYTKERVPLNMITGDRDIPSMIEATLLTKSSVWEYEKEWRILHAPGLFTLPVPCVSGLIIGAKADKALVDSLVSLVRADRPDFPIYRARLSTTRFEIVRDLI